MAARRSPRHGVWRVELAPVRDEEFVDYAVVEALGLVDHTTRLPRETLLAHLAERELLLVLDGVEHVVEACASLTAELLGRAPGLRVLAVGRRPLDVPGERVVPLAPLRPEEAVELLAVRPGSGSWLPVRRRRPGRGPGGGARAVPSPGRDSAGDRAGGGPSRRTVAAADAAAPGRPLPHPDRRDRTALPRHRTLRTAIGWSHELCTPAERLLWARLSVFTGSFDLEAAEYVCSGDGLPADEVLDVLSALLAQSVLTREETPAGVRYRMLDTVRAYGGDWLEATGDASRVRRRHRDWYVGLATWCELEWFSPRQREVAARVDAELPNLRGALEHSLTEPTRRTWAVPGGCPVVPLGRLRPAVGGAAVAGAAVRLDAEGTAGEQSRLKALWVLGYVAVLQGDTAHALAALQECRREAERSANATAVAYAEHRTGCLALVTDDMPRAETLLRSALHRYREIGELNSNVLMGQVELAMARAFQGDLPDAVRLCEDVRRVCETTGSAGPVAMPCTCWRTRPGTTASRCGPGAAGRLPARCAPLPGPAGIGAGGGAAGPGHRGGGRRGGGGGVAGRGGPDVASVGLPLFGSAHYNAPHELCEATAREQLGDERYEECVRHGAGLGRREVVTRALRRPGPPVPLPAPRGAATGAGARTAKPAASPTRKGGETAG